MITENMAFCRWNSIWNTCVLCIGLISLLAIFTQGDKITCDIEDSTKYPCSAGHCCVRNTSMFTDTYCAPLGEEGSVCTTYSSRYFCPCGDKFFCEKAANDSSFGNCKPKIVDIPCDLASRNVSCPTGMCCVRDEFLFSYTYCKALGIEGSSCVTHPSYFECPCREGYNCRTNLQGGHVNSLFGSCKAMATYPPSVSTPATSAAEITTETLAELSTVADKMTDTTSKLEQTTQSNEKPDDGSTTFIPLPVVG